MASPSTDPANLDTVAGQLKEIFGKFMQDVNGMLPARIVSVDNDSTPARVSVQPLVNIGDTEGNSVKQAVINGIPVVVFGGGDYMINLKLKTGDYGYIFASDRDIANAVATGQESQPNTARTHSFSDAIFLPALVQNYVNKTEQLSIQSRDGNTFISFNNGAINIKSTNTVIAGDTTINGNTVINGNVTMNGNLRVVGNITASGTITPNVP